MNEMINNFSNERQNNSTLLDIFILQIHDEILNNGTVTDTIMTPDLDFLTFRFFRFLGKVV